VRVTETWICNYTPVSLMVPSDYRVFSCDPQGHGGQGHGCQGHGGGVALFVCDVFNVEHVSLLLRSLIKSKSYCVDLSFDEVDYTIIGVCRPPGECRDGATYLAD